MSQRIQIVFAAVALFATTRLFGGDPGPTQSVSPDGNQYHSPIPINDPFPDANYGADHGGSSLTIVYPYVSQFGYTDHSRGHFLYQVAPFYPRNSEGVFGMDVWLEQQDSSGNWNAVAGQYQPVNTPNPGPSPSYSFTWNYSSFPPNTNFRIFVYVYIYNQGGGSQGDFPIYSSTAPVNTGAANDAPRISWSSSYGSTNPTQVQAGQTYTVSADGQDDNGNLVAVSINKNGQPFAYAGGGTGYSGNSQNPTSDPVGIVTFTAWATDSYGAQSPTITWTVNVIGKSNQSPVGSSNASFPFFSQNFTPAYYGGSGSGAWQFCIAGYTNWDAGNSSYAGTNLGPSPGNSPGAVWVPSWSPPAPGSYQFWVAKDGDANYNPSGAVGTYTLTVTPAVPVGSFDGVGPNPVTQGQTINGSGWAADAQLGAPLSSVRILVDGGANGSFSAGLGGYRPDVQSANTSWGHWSPNNITNSGWSFSYNTAGLGQGGHTFTAVAYDNNYGVSATIGSQSFTVSAPLGQTVTIAPTSQTIHPGQAITFTASGGVNGYVWGGSATGGGSSQTVTFPSVGNYSVTVYSPAGNGYNQSNTATATITVTVVGQTVSLTPTTATIYAGQSVSFTASGGQNGYIWGGAASGSGTSQLVSFPNVGTYTVTVYSPAGGIYALSNTATATITVTPASQTVTISPQNPSITAGGSIQFTAAGGQNGYIWGGLASGSGTSQLVSFPNVGTYTVTVYSPAGGNFAQSNMATATITVTTASQTGTISPQNPSITAGGSIQFTALGGQNGYVWGGLASGSGTSQLVNFPNVGTYTVTVYSPAGSNFAQSNTATTTIIVTPAGQTVSLAPVSPTIYAGQSVAFTANGGVNGYVWGGSASGSGNSQTVTFPNTGTYAVNVYSPAGNGFNQSNTAASTITVNPISTVFSGSPISFSYNGSTQGPVLSSSPAGASHNVSGTSTAINAGSYSFTVTATGQYSGTNTFDWSILPANQSPVAISPATATVSAGQSVSFTASGGSGSGAYVWGGAATGTGSITSVTFQNQGNFTVSAYKAADENYVQSSLASSSVTVLNPTYTLTVNAGPGGAATGSASGLAGTETPPISASPNSGYAFILWTGDPVANPTSAATTVAMNNANRTVTATFTALQPQTITFIPPATALFPGPALTLTATATSGLHVSFSVLAGPATLAGSVLTFTGTGNVIVQASQSGGWNGSTDYQPAPNVSATIQVNTPFTIIRLRFNSPSVLSRSVDSNNVGHTSTGHGQSSFIWTDPAGIQSSPWPTFNGPATLVPVQTNIRLPLAPAAGPGQANSTPTGGR